MKLYIYIYISHEYSLPGNVLNSSELGQGICKKNPIVA